MVRSPPHLPHYYTYSLQHGSKKAINKHLRTGQSPLWAQINLPGGRELFTEVRGFLSLCSTPPPMHGQVHSNKQDWEGDEGNCLGGCSSPSQRVQICALGGGETRYCLMLTTVLARVSCGARCKHLREHRPASEGLTEMAPPV
jgi:hypothetical protein